MSDKTIIAVLGIIILVSLCLIFSQTIWAEGYLVFPQTVHRGPTICAFEPLADVQFPTVGKQLLDETEYAVTDWKTKLNQGLGKHPIWNMSLVRVPLSSQSSFKNSQCDIEIHFLKKPGNPKLEFALAGITMPNLEDGKSRIEIYYLDIQPNWVQVEWTEHDTIYYTYVNKPYYTNLIATSTQLGSTIRHEIGHALGLGHYTVSDDSREKIVNGIMDMPSIMIDTTAVLGVQHYDITPLDVAQIKSIYGDGGFDSSTKHTGFQRINAIESAALIEKYNLISISINPENLADSAGYVMILDSNNKLQDDLVIGKNNSTFSFDAEKYQKDENYTVEFIDMQKGFYDFAILQYGGGQDGSDTSNNPVDQIKPNTSPEQNDLSTVSPSSIVSIPSWLKHNANLWSKGDIGDETFVNAIQYLIQQKIITIPPATKASTSQTTIPGWVKKDAGWWSSGELEDGDFIKAIQYLVINGIINP